MARDDAYLRNWKARDAELQANGFGPSKLGPGVPAKIEEPTALGRLFGMKHREWDDSGIEITGGGGQMNVPPPDPRMGGAGGGLRPPDHPYVGPPRGMCDECGQPEMAHDEDEEEARGPGGPKMPRAVDLPNYTVWGRLLKHFDR